MSGQSLRQSEDGWIPLFLPSSSPQIELQLNPRSSTSFESTREFSSPPRSRTSGATSYSPVFSSVPPTSAPRSTERERNVQLGERGRDMIEDEAVLLVPSTNEISSTGLSSRILSYEGSGVTDLTSRNLASSSFTPIHRFPSSSTTPAPSPSPSTMMRRQPSSALDRGSKLRSSDSLGSSTTILTGVVSLTSLMDRSLQQQRRKRQLLRLGLACLSIIFLSRIASYGYLGPTFQRILHHSTDSITSSYSTMLKQSLSAPFPFHASTAYDVATHPRTQSIGERGISLNDFLTTRLGSHFSTPSSGIPTQLWITFGSKESVVLSSSSLHEFVTRERTVNEEEGNVVVLGVQDEGDDRTMTGIEQQLVVMCVDEGCMQYCRTKEWYCYGGFISGSMPDDDGQANQIWEKVKIEAIIQTLSSGRRVIVVDTGVYFTADPLPHLAPLYKYDMQIPDSWTSFNLDVGFVYLNPTQHVITLFQRIRSESNLRSNIPHNASLVYPNFLLDPTGVPRVRPITAESLTLIDESEVIVTDIMKDRAVEGVYGQNQFTSTWGGGIDVNILERKKFRSATGEGIEWESEWERHRLYLHCSCADAPSMDYLASSLSLVPSSSKSILETMILDLPSSSLTGSTEEILYTLGLLLQLAHDSSRSAIPPAVISITTLLDPTTTNSAIGHSPERKIWNVFPVGEWSAGSRLLDAFPSPFPLPLLNVHVLSPSYLSQSLLTLRSRRHSTPTKSNPKPDLVQSSQPQPRRSTLLPTLTSTIATLSNPVWLNLAAHDSYSKALAVLNRPFYSTTLLVRLEGVDRVRGQEGWLLRREFELEMCGEEGESGDKKNAGESEEKDDEEVGRRKRKGRKGRERGRVRRNACGGFCVRGK